MTGPAGMTCVNVAFPAISCPSIVFPANSLCTLREPGQDLGERDFVQRRLGTFKEQLGKALFPQTLAGPDLQNRAPVGAFDLKRLPGLSVQ